MRLANNSKIFSKAGSLNSFKLHIDILIKPDHDGPKQAAWPQVNWSKTSSFNYFSLLSIKNGVQYFNFKKNSLVYFCFIYITQNIFI